MKTQGTRQKEPDTIRDKTQGKGHRGKDKMTKTQGTIPKGQDTRAKTQGKIDKGTAPRDKRQGTRHKGLGNRINEDKTKHKRNEQEKTRTPPKGTYDNDNYIERMNLN